MPRWPAVCKRARILGIYVNCKSAMASGDRTTDWMEMLEQPLVTAFKRNEGNRWLVYPDGGNLYNVGTAGDIERDTGGDHDIVILGSK